MRLNSSLLLALNACGFMIVAFGASRIWACANDYEDRLPRESKSIVWDRMNGADYARALSVHEQPKNEVLQAKKLAAEKGDFRDQSNYAVALMRRGHYAEARDILAKLAVEHDSEYVIAANLGTAYELSGDVPNALKWIRRGLELDSNSHEGTEWLHVRILRAILAAQSDPNWFEKNTILSLDFGTEAMPKRIQENVRNEDGYEKDLDSVRHALEYQLHERLFFIQDPDPVVADLLMDLGNILMVSGNLDKAAEVFNLVKRFQLRVNSLLLARQSEIEKSLTARRNAAAEHEKHLQDLKYAEEHPIYAGVRPYLARIIWGVGLIVGLLGFIAYQRRRNSPAKTEVTLH